MGAGSSLGGHAYRGVPGARTALGPDHRGTRPPVAGPGQVVVDVEAAGVNYVDALFVAGPVPDQAPPARSSPAARSPGPWRPSATVWTGVAGGRRACWPSCGLGGFAEQVAVPAAASCAGPPGLDAARAAAVHPELLPPPCSRCATGPRLRPGETVLVLGAGGGRRSGRHRRGPGPGRAGHRRRLHREQAGRGHGHGRRRGDRHHAPSASRTGPASWPASWPSSAGPAAVDRRGRGGRPGGRRPGRAGPAGPGRRRPLRGHRLRRRAPSPPCPLNQILLRNRSVVGVDWGAWAMAHGDEQRALLASLLDLVADRPLHPPAPATYPLDQAGDRPGRPPGPPGGRQGGARPLT